MPVAGIDLSNFQWWFHDGHARLLRDSGRRFVFIGQQRVNAWKADQEAYCRQVGMAIGYYLESLGGAWPASVPDDVRYIAVAVEEGSEFATEADIDNALAWIASVGKVPVIYSSAAQWDHLGLGGVTKYDAQGILLWNAHYDGRADGFALRRPFGGWTACAIDQYAVALLEGMHDELDLNECIDGLFTFGEESDVPLETEPLDQAESIDALERAARSMAGSLNDSGTTVVRVVSGLPEDVAKYVPPGGHAYIFTSKD